MPRLQPNCMLDRTPVLFGATSNFLNIGKDAVSVFAVATIQTFERIEV